MARKLDRVLINSVWLHMYAQSTVEFLPLRDSDHYATHVQLWYEVKAPPKPFKFFNCWTRHVEFMAV